VPRGARRVKLRALGALVLLSCGSLNHVSPAETSPAGATVAAIASPSASPSPVHTAAPIADPSALGMSRRTLGARSVAYGRYPDPILFVVECPNWAIGRYQRAAPPGFFYVSEGTTTMVTSSSRVDVHAGEAAAFPNELWEMQNPGPGPLSYIDLFVYDNSARGTSPCGPPAVFSLPVESPSGVAIELRLDHVTIDASGRSDALIHGGADAIIVLSGAIEVREPNGQHSFIGAHQGAYVAALTGVQLFALDGQPATLLELFHTPVDRPFATRLDASP